MSEPDAPPHRRRRVAAGLLAGAVIAFALPPWGWWPLAFVGTALLSVSTYDRSAAARFGTGWLMGATWMLIGMSWMWFLTAPGFVVASALFACLHGAAAALTPTDRRRMYLGPALHTTAEVIRWTMPFGGVPLATLAMAMSGSPFIAVARVGGTTLLTWLVFQVGALAATATTPRPRWAVTGASAAAVISTVLVSVAAPSGHDVGQPVSVAAVQGGGLQGTTALEVPVAQVFAAHDEATSSIRPGVDMVIWPENGIGLTGARTPLASSRELAALAAQARRLDAPILVGITENSEFSRHPVAGSFVNAQVVINRDGTIGDRYEKVHIVPFGEYVPLRGLLTALGVDLSLVGMDATRGQDPAQLRVALPEHSDRPTPDVTVGVMISWEVFFGDRGRAAVANGAQMLINPTNGASYTGTIVQTQQVASSRLRAVETGRWVVQDSPTGFSAFVRPDGTVLDRTDVSEQAVITTDVPRRAGTTWYTALGDAPFVGAVLVVAIVGLLTPRASRLVTSRRGR